MRRCNSRGTARLASAMCCSLKPSTFKGGAAQRQRLASSVAHDHIVILLRCECIFKCMPTTVWPSGLRRWTQVPLSSDAWVRTPQPSVAVDSQVNWKSIDNMLQFELSYSQCPGRFAQIMTCVVLCLCLHGILNNGCNHSKCTKATLQLNGNGWACIRPALFAEALKF